MKRIGIIVSSPLTVKAFLLDQIDALSASYQVCLVLNLEKGDSIPGLNPKVEVVAAPIVRKISVLRDLQALLVLVALFLRRKFDAIHSVTPKAGLLAMLAGKLARVPVRIHMFTGQMWATRTGLSRMIFENLDRLLATCATHILVDSHSQMNFLVRERVVPARKTSVLAKGSISGVDAKRFHPEPYLRDRMRTALDIPRDSTVLTYIGRLRREKGVLDLAEAFSRLCRTNSNVYLIVVGSDEEDMRPRIRSFCAACSERLRFVDYTTTPEQFMASADVLCLPSYREGFGSVIIEAAACEIPSLASRIYGVTDAIVDKVTGVLHEAANVDDLAHGMQRMIDDPTWRNALGSNARARAVADFLGEKVTAAVLEYYRHVLS